MEEKRLIDANGLLSDIMMLPQNGDMISSEEVEQAIMDSPAVDAVEVVRCRDCKHYEQTTMCTKFLGLTIPKADNFCSYGERRTDG